MNKRTCLYFLCGRPCQDLIATTVSLFLLRLEAYRFHATATPTSSLSRNSGSREDPIVVDDVPQTQVSFDEDTIDIDSDVIDLNEELSSEDSFLDFEDPCDYFDEDSDFEPSESVDCTGDSDLDSDHSFE